MELTLNRKELDELLLYAVNNRYPGFNFTELDFDTYHTISKVIFTQPEKAD